MKSLGKAGVTWLIFNTFLCCCASGCSPKTMEDIRIEMDAEVKRLVKELKELDSKEAIERRAPSLRKKWNRIADLLLKAEPLSKEVKPPTEGSELLFIEMARIYEIPGGKVALEATQNEAASRIYKKYAL